VITGGRGVSTIPENFTAAAMVATASALAVVMAIVELFIHIDSGGVIDSDRTMDSDWMVKLDQNRVIVVMCSDQVVEMDSDLALSSDPDWFAAKA
jgi:hypothetical protein